MTSTSTNTKRRCAACSYTHKACPIFCDGDEFYPDIISRNDYHLIFHIYGVATARKIMERAPDSQRHKCIRSLLLEARERINNPADGSVGRIISLEQTVSELQSRVLALEARLDQRSANVTPGLPSPVKGGYVDLLMAVEENLPGDHLVQENPPMSVEFPAAVSLSPYLTLSDYQAALDSYSQSSEVGVSSNPQGEVPQVSPQGTAVCGSFDLHSSVQINHLEVDISHFRPSKRLRLEQTDPSFTDKDLSGIDLPWDASGNPIDLSSLGFDADNSWNFGEKPGGISHNPIDLPFPDLPLPDLPSPSLDVNDYLNSDVYNFLCLSGEVDGGSQTSANIAEKNSEVAEFPPSPPPFESKGKGPIVD